MNQKCVSRRLGECNPPYLPNEEGRKEKKRGYRQKVLILLAMFKYIKETIQNQSGKNKKIRDGI